MINVEVHLINEDVIETFFENEEDLKNFINAVEAWGKFVDAEGYTHLVPKEIILYYSYKEEKNES